MLGEWNGEYWFIGRATKVFKDRKTKFKINITELQKSTFSGSVTDDNESGGTKGIGLINGVRIDNTVKFTKQMPVSTVVMHSGDRIEENKPHRPIYYSGTISKDGKKITGTWKFKIGFGRVNGKFCFFPGTKGNWEMERA